jgi:hypothetical protein
VRSCISSVAVFAADEPAVAPLCAIALGKLIAASDAPAAFNMLRRDNLVCIRI